MAPSFARIFFAVDRSMYLVTAILIVVLMVVMVGSIWAGVFFRYVLDNSLIWSEEVARYAMIWVSMLGGGLAFRKGAHVAVEFVTDRLPHRARLVLKIIGGGAILFFLVLLLWYGIDVTQRVSRQTTAALRISMFWPYVALPLGAALMIYHMLVVVLVPSLRPARREEVSV